MSDTMTPPMAGVELDQLLETLKTGPKVAGGDEIDHSVLNNVSAHPPRRRRTRHGDPSRRSDHLDRLGLLASLRPGGISEVAGQSE
jgi:hypothetical protein